MWAHHFSWDVEVSVRGMLGCQRQVSALTNNITLHCCVCVYVWWQAAIFSCKTRIPVLYCLDNSSYHTHLTILISQSFSLGTFQVYIWHTHTFEPIQYNTLLELKLRLFLHANTQHRQYAVHVSACCCDSLWPIQTLKDPEGWEGTSITSHYLNDLKQTSPIF